MKKLLLTTITLATILSFSGCQSNSNTSSGVTGGSGSVNVSTSTSTSSSTSESSFNSETVKGSLSTETYTWNEGSFYYAAIIIKNNSDKDCELTVDVIFKNADGQAIGTGSDTIYAFEKGTEACFVFNNESEFASFDYNCDVSKATLYTAATSSVSCEATTTTGKAILSFTNNSNEDISNLAYDVLFMQGDTVIEHSQGYIFDELPAGSTKAKEAKCFNNKMDFDNIKYYYYANKTKY